MVEISKEAIEDAIEAAGMEGWDHIEYRMRAFLTTAAPHMSAPAREQALEEAARVGDTSSESWMKKRDVTANKKEARDYETMAIACSFLTAAIRALKSQPAPQHPDDIAVDNFAAQMKAKLAKKRAEGRSGWQNMSAHDLSVLLHEHVAKGDPIDVANLCMMLAMDRQHIIPAPQTGGGE